MRLRPRPDNSLANWTALSEQLGDDCLRVASYNVHACRGSDGKKDASRIAAVIEETGCDTNDERSSIHDRAEMESNHTTASARCYKRNNREAP